MYSYHQETNTYVKYSLHTYLHSVSVDKDERVIITRNDFIKLSSVVFTFSFYVMTFDLGVYLHRALVSTGSTGSWEPVKFENNPLMHIDFKKQM